jgi:hypothetical protein
LAASPARKQELCSKWFKIWLSFSLINDTALNSHVCLSVGTTKGFGRDKISIMFTEFIYPQILRKRFQFSSDDVTLFVPGSNYVSARKKGNWKSNYVPGTYLTRYSNFLSWVKNYFMEFIILLPSLASKVPTGKYLCRTITKILIYHLLTNFALHYKLIFLHN